MKIRSKLYKFYRYKIYEKISAFRGSYALLRNLREAASKGIETPDEKPVEFLEEDWDNLIILDACRHDLYEEVNGETPSRISPASHTKDFIKETFTQPPYDDIVYITANPQFSQPILKDLIGESEIFHTQYNVFHTDWNDENNTVLPDPVSRDALNAQKLFSDKKLIVHFMQPHYPFIQTDLVFGGQADREEIKEGHNKESVWVKAEKGELDGDEVWKAYRENLEKVMPKVRKLAENLDGKTVITSDHGNLVGENRLYGHPGELNLKPLRKVPWEVIDE